MIAGLLSFVAGPIGRWVLVAIAVAALLAGVRMQAYNAGYDKRDAEVTAATAEANQMARAAERAASDRMGALATTHHQEIENARIETDRLRADLRSSARRLSIPATTACLPVRTDPAPAGGTGAEIRSALDPATAEALVAIASDGDIAIRQANALIDAYAVAAEVCGR